MHVLYQILTDQSYTPPPKPRLCNPIRLLTELRVSSWSAEDELPGMNKIIAPPNGHTVPHAPESAPLHLPGEVGN
eukprot:5144472-Amphidinium_carterae.1